MSLSNRGEVSRTRAVLILAAIALVVFGADTGLVVGRAKVRANNATCLWFQLASVPTHPLDVLAVSEATANMHPAGLSVSDATGKELFGTHKDALHARRRLEGSHFEGLVILRYAISDATSCISNKNPPGWRTN